jgi:putative membrane protein
MGKANYRPLSLDGPHFPGMPLATVVGKGCKGATNMKISLAMLIVVAFATASGAQQSSTGAQQTSTKPNQSSSRAAAGESAFAMKAAQANIAEVELGKLAQQKAKSDDVKKFAQMMVDDHSKALDELKSVAGPKSITLPTALDAEHKKLSDRLSKLSGAGFDREYMQAMVDGHRKVAADVRKESKSGADPDLKAWAAKALPTVEAHLKQAETVNRSVHSATSTH